MSPQHAAMLAQSMPSAAQAKSAADALRFSVALALFAPLNAHLLTQGAHGLMWDSADISAGVKHCLYAADIFISLAKTPPQQIAEEVALAADAADSLQP